MEDFCRRSPQNPLDAVVESAGQSSSPEPVIASWEVPGHEQFCGGSLSALNGAHHFFP